MVVLLAAVKQHIWQMGMVQVVWRQLCFNSYTGKFAHLSVLCGHVRNKVACVNLCAALICENIHFQAVITGCKCAEPAVFADGAVTEEMMVQASN